MNAYLLALVSLAFGMIAVAIGNKSRFVTAVCGAVAVGFAVAAVVSC